MMKIMPHTHSAMVVVLMLMAMIVTVKGHGMVIDPPQRSSIWRFDPSFPKNYNDNQLYCGGYARQWKLNGGKCGICGDPYDTPEPRDNEAKGKYAKGLIVRTYQQSDVIEVTVKITANHRGYFQFKLCPNNDVTKEATQQCLDDHVLEVVGNSGIRPNEKTKYFLDNSVGDKKIKLQLPSDVTCTQCVLQWTYNTGNSWGCNDDNDECCVGCGPQENFVNCVDIAITSNDNSGEDKDTTPTTTTTTTTTTTVKPKVTQSTTSPRTTTTMEQPKKTDFLAKTEATSSRQQITTTTPEPTTASTSTTKQTKDTPPPPKKGTCEVVGPYRAVLGMKQWCQYNCARHYCPPSHCRCT